MTPTWKQASVNSGKGVTPLVGAEGIDECLLIERRDDHGSTRIEPHLGTLPFYDDDRHRRDADAIARYRDHYRYIERLYLILDAEGDSLNRYKLAKQADALMLLYLLGEEELLATFDELRYCVARKQLHATLDFYLGRWEAACSLSDPGSELSRIARQELTSTAASSRVRKAYAHALRWREITNGTFTPHRGDSNIDLNGVVKALRVEEAGRELELAKAPSCAVNASRGVLVSPDSATQWRIGVVDPTTAAR